MTLERVIVDLSRAFEPSQIYVARMFNSSSLFLFLFSLYYPEQKKKLPHRLETEANAIYYFIVSRARSLKGLKVIGLPRANLGGANEQVKEFFDKYLKKK